MTITTTKPSTGPCPTDPHTADIDGRSNRDRSTRPGLHDRPDHRPSLSTTIEREHVVFTRSPALTRECTQITGPLVANHVLATQTGDTRIGGTQIGDTQLGATQMVAGQLETQAAIDVSDDDHFLLDQPRHVAERLPCRTQNADLWFAETPAELDQAKALCADCPARRACLAGAVARREPWGVWGGEIFDRGAIIARKRPRGRPRKDEVAA